MAEGAEEAVSAQVVSQLYFLLSFVSRQARRLALRCSRCMRALRHVA